MSKYKWIAVFFCITLALSQGHCLAEEVRANALGIDYVVLAVDQLDSTESYMLTGQYALAANGNDFYRVITKGNVAGIRRYFLVTEDASYRNSASVLVNSESRIYVHLFSIDPDVPIRYFGFSIADQSSGTHRDYFYDLEAEDWLPEGSDVGVEIEHDTVIFW